MNLYTTGWRDEEQSHERYIQRNEKRAMKRSGKDIHTIPMTITGCTKRHLTINGSIQCRNSNLNGGLDWNGIQDCGRIYAENSRPKDQAD